MSATSPARPGMTDAELAALPSVVTLEQAARALGIGRDLAYRLARAGEFPVPFRPSYGGRRHVTKADLLAHLGYDVPAPRSGAA